ncbi:MAG: hypothetical protein ACI4LB_03310 [Candidatus Fimenecus sp.]
MKKVFSVLVALMMLFALCIPAFAGAAVDALTDEDAKAFAQAVVAYGGDLKEETVMTEATNAGAKAIRVDRLANADRRAEIATLATEAIATDYEFTEAEKAMFAEKAAAALDSAYDLGISTFDPSEVVDNVADGFSDNDLAGLFDTLRNTITDLSDRLSNAFIENSGSGDSTNTDNNNSSSTDNNSTADNTYGGTEPTGDTAIYAVAGVAAAAAVALVLTKKKSK